jgi:RimJ/RimL family protein N-acetyltransferase
MYGVMRQGDLVGVCGLTSIDLINQRAEFSLYIGPEYQGLGYGKAALLTLITHGFRVLNLNCIWGETFNKNPAAEMFEELGFKKEGTRRDFYFRDGRFINAHLYSLLRSEWKSRFPGGGVVDEQTPTEDAQGGEVSPSLESVAGRASAS